MTRKNLKSISLAILLALGGGALLNQHHSAHASTNNEPTVSRKTSEASMPQTRAFFYHLNKAHPYGMNINTQSEAKAIRHENTNNQKQQKVNMQIGHPVSAEFPNNNKMPSQYINNSVKSTQNTTQYNTKRNIRVQNDSNDNTKFNSLNKQSLQDASHSNDTNNLSQKLDTVNSKINHNLGTVKHGINSQSNESQNWRQINPSSNYQNSEYVKAPTSKSTVSQPQSMSQNNKTSLSIDYQNDKYVRVPVNTSSQDVNTDLKFVSEDLDSQAKSYATAHNGSVMPGLSSANSALSPSKYPHTYQSETDYENDTYVNVPVYKVASNKNYNFDEGTDDNTNFYQTGFSESKPDNNIQYQDGNQKMSFNNPIYLKYKNHVHAKHHGDPQSVSILPHNRALVLFNVNHGDSLNNKNNYDRILEYNSNSGKYIRKGQTFLGAHGQGLAYNPADNSLWLINNRSSYTKTPKWIRISQQTLQPTGRIMNVQTPGVFGNDLAFDNQGNAYNVVKVTNDNNIIHAPKDSLAITVGHKQGNKYVFHYVQGLRYSPGHIIQNLAYNPNNGRMYIICNSSIVSFPTSKINHLTSNDIKTTTFKHHFEMEDLGFTKNQTYLLMNWPARLMRKQ